MRARWSCGLRIEHGAWGMEYLSALSTTLEKPHTKTKAGNPLGRGALDLDLAGDRSKHAPDRSRGVMAERGHRAWACERGALRRASVEACLLLLACRQNVGSFCESISRLRGANIKKPSPMQNGRSNAAPLACRAARRRVRIPPLVATLSKGKSHMLWRRKKGCR